MAGETAEHHGLVFDTEAMLASDIGNRSKFYAPYGRFYLLRDAQAFVGVGALQRIDAITAEIQRMYVQPPWRGRGAARLLLGRLLDDARATPPCFHSAYTWIQDDWNAHAWQLPVVGPTR